MTKRGRRAAIVLVIAALAATVSVSRLARDASPRTTPGDTCAALEAAGSLAGGRRLICGRGIDPNRAGAADLALLPGIGEVRARAIVEWREANGPFEDVGDLQKIKGIGEKTVERLRPWLEIGIGGTQAEGERRERL